MPDLYFNEESDYSEVNTCDNKVFCYPILQPFQFNPEQKKTCGNETHEKETINIFTVQLPIYYILEQEISICENADIAKTKREELIVVALKR